MICLSAADGNVHEHVLMTQPKASENVFWFGYVM